MKRVLMGVLTAVTLSVSPFALTAAVAAGDPAAEAASSERGQHWASDHRAMMDARLGGIKEPSSRRPLNTHFGKSLRTLCATRTRHGWTTGAT